MTAPSTALIAATRDQTLKDRTVALAATLGMTENEVEAAWRSLIVTNADNTGKMTIADIYAYALDVRRQELAKLPPEVGANLAAVTDEHLLFALRQALKDKKEN